MTGISLRSQAGAMEPYHTGIVQSASGFHSVQRAAGHLAVDLLLLLLRCQVGSVHVFCCCRWCLCFLGFFFFFFIAMFVVLFVNAVVGEAINFVDDGLWRGEKNREGKRKDFTFYYSSSIISCFFSPCILLCAFVISFHIFCTLGKFS